jgi:hypothetical protein
VARFEGRKFGYDDRELRGDARCAREARGL